MNEFRTVEYINEFLADRILEKFKIYYVDEYIKLVVGEKIGAVINDNDVIIPIRVHAANVIRVSDINIEKIDVIKEFIKCVEMILGKNYNKEPYDPEKRIREYTSNLLYNIDWFHRTSYTFIPKYDDNGRMVNCDPNVSTGNLNVDGKQYKVLKTRWKKSVYDVNGDLVFEIDDTPQYVMN